MITLSTTLEAAAQANSRSPTSSIAVESITPDFSVIAGLAMPYTVHRIQRSGSFYIATAYGGVGIDEIYVKRMTSVTLAADWNAGWVFLVTTSAGRAVRHDLFVSGNDVIVAYTKDFLSDKLYVIESGDGGQTWGAETLVTDPTGGVISVALANLNCMYMATSDNGAPNLISKMYRVSRTAKGNPWTVSGNWDNGLYFFRFPGDYDQGVLSQQLYAAELSDGGHLVLFEAVAGYFRSPGSAKGTTWIFKAIYKNGDWSLVRRCFGGIPTDLDYRYRLRGLSRDLNGYLFLGLCEEYGAKADAGGLTIGYEFNIGRTVDGDPCQFVPTDITAAAGSDTASTQYIAGVVLAQNDTQICIPVSQHNTPGLVYLCDASSWWGESPSETDITDHVVEQASLSQTVRSAAKVALTLSNINGRYRDHAVMKGGSVVRIATGYNTGAGAERQQRFVGTLSDSQDSVGSDEVLTFDAYDLLHRASAVQRMHPHVLMGQNVFSVDFDDALDIDHFVPQNGVWEISGNVLQQTELGINACTIAGFDPNDARIILAKFNSNTSVTDVMFGLVACWSPIVQVAVIACWNGSNARIELRKLNLDTMAWKSGVTQSALGYGWTADTDYWLMAAVKHSSITVYYSTDGINWIEAIPATSMGNIDYYSYPGLFCYIPEASAAMVKFDDFQVFSMYESLCDSQVMDYLAVLAGLDTNEQAEIDDAFAGVAYGSDWNTPGVGGTWTVSGGYARGCRTGADPALLRCGVSASDVVVTATLSAIAAGGGLLIRGNSTLTECYAAFVSTTTVTIEKKSASVWTTLFSIPKTTSGTFEMTFVGRGPYLSVFMNGVLRGVAYDTDLTSGYVGLASDSACATVTLHDSFTVRGFYKPRDVITVRPGDNLLSIMTQLADLYSDGQFYCDYNGALKWGIFDALTVDLDVRQDTLQMSAACNISKILTVAHVIGANIYGQSRLLEWAIELLGHRYQQIQDASIATTELAVERAAAELADYAKIYEEAVTMPGHPGLELCDVVRVARSPSDTPRDRRVMSLTETIGGVYESQLSGLESLEAESP